MIGPLRRTIIVTPDRLRLIATDFFENGWLIGSCHTPYKFI